MKASLIELTYRRFAPIYDTIFGAVLQPGRKRGVQILHCQMNQQVLEVGVGTGLSLDLYPDSVKIVGIDICPDMLKRAQARVEARQLQNVQALVQMDGRKMSFPDNSFDKVIAMYVIPALDDPRPLVAEMRRVCKPDGELIFINHFQSRRAVVGTIERLLSPLWRWLNYRSDLKLEDFVRDAKLDVIETQDTNILGYATLVRCRNHDGQPLVPHESREFIGDLLTEES
ncbi:MAG: methyltransferase domain-containing protein [Gammaproteobacteria bacterium]|nr:methyltransferase domain-containing protein [Gammaproteobacteria bacterium]